ncbi:MAG TPA: MFS transporter [bacterium]|nr:MFS transporter [bacterium]
MDTGALHELILPVLLIGTFMSTLDFFIVNVAIPSMQHDLGASPAAIEWVVAGYALAFGCGLVTGGRLGDHYGRRRVLFLGLLLFTITSTLCALAPNPAVLVLSRILQGASAALLSPQVLAIVSTIFAGEARARAFQAYGLTLGIAAVFGQLIGGLLIQANILNLGWRTCFLINAPIGFAAMALVPKVIPQLRPPTHSRLDVVGVGILSVALLALLWPLIQGQQRGWPIWALRSFLASPLLLIVFAAWERALNKRGGAPMVNPALFEERAFTAGLLTQLVFWMGIASFFLIFALYMQQGRGLSALEAGATFMAIGGGYLATSLIATRLARRLGRQVVSTGALLMAAGLGILSLTVLPGRVPLGWLVPGLIFEGAGMGIALAPLVSIILVRVMPEHAGAASGVLTTTQQIGNALGVAVIGAVFFRALDPTRAAGYDLAFSRSVVALLVISLTVVGFVQLLPRRHGEL